MPAPYSALDAKFFSPPQPAPLESGIRCAANRHFRKLPRFCDLLRKQLCHSNV